MKVEFEKLLDKAQVYESRAEQGDSMLFVCEGFVSRYTFGKDSRTIEEWVDYCVKGNCGNCSLLFEEFEEDEEDEDYEPKMVEKTVVFDVGIVIEVPEDATEDEIVELAIMQASNQSAYDLLHHSFDHIV